MTSLLNWYRCLLDAIRLAVGRAPLDREERDMREELNFHIDQLRAKHLAAGMSPNESTRQALATFGGIGQVSEAARDEFRSRPLDDFGRDVRYGVRAFRRAPAFTAFAVLTLSLGTAASVAVFTFVESVYLRPLPVPHGDRLVRVFLQHSDDISSIGYNGFKLLRDHTTAFDAVAAHYSTAPLYVHAGDQAGEVQGAIVSSSYFGAMGLRPTLGRFFTSSEDDVPDRDFVAVIGYGMWQRWFGSDPGVIGRTITINDKAFSIIGVGPRGFNGVLPGQAANELWIPMMTIHAGYRWCDGLSSSCAVFDVIGRLAPRATASDARIELSAVSRQIADAASDTSARVVMASASGLPVQGRRALDGLAQLLSAVGATLLLIACANLAGLLLTRGLAREREVAVRVSLGAGRARIVRQLLAESLILATAGAIGGFLLSLLAVRSLGTYLEADSEGYTRFYDLSPNAHVFAFVALLAIVTTLSFGLFPALAATRRGAANQRGDDRFSATGGRARLVLISGQTALSLMLLVMAALLSRSLGNLMFQGRLNPHHVALLRLRPRLVGYDAMRAQAFLHRVVERLDAQPDVESVALARGSGLVWRSTGEIRFASAGDRAVPADRQARIQYHEISPRFFATLQVPLMRGREFTDHDGVDAPRVAVVNETLARRIATGGAALGRAVVLDDKEFQIVGVVADYRPYVAGESSPAMAFVPFWQNNFDPQVDARMAVRVRGDPSLALATLRRAIAEVDPSVPVTEALAMTQQVDDAFVDVHLGRAVALFAGVLALVLSAIGLHGVVAFLVDRRRREIGVRLAVGAEPASIVALILAQGMRPVAVGVVCGLALALGSARLMSRWLYNVSPTDFTAFALAACATCVIGAIASYIPARRAARIDPVSALRLE